MSTPHFNQLSPAEAERLSLLIEECAEVIQIIGKIQRHGYDSSHPNGGPNNRDMLSEEMGHVRAASFLLTATGGVSARTVQEHADRKSEGYAANKYLHHQ